jgi:hypothetical protein
MDERRKSERVDTHLHAQWETASGNHHGIIINGTIGGCFVQAQVEEPGDEPMKLVITLPKGVSIHFWGEVAYYLPTMGFGLHFNHFSDEGQIMLNTWIDYLETLK